MKLRNPSRFAAFIVLLLLGATLTLVFTGSFRGYLNGSYAFAKADDSSVSPKEQGGFVPPSLSILEASDLPGYMVTIQGQIAEDDAHGADNRKLQYVKDETGGIHLVIAPGLSLKKGDRVLVTGKIVYKQGRIEINPAAGGIQRLK